ncbi:MAG: peptidase M64 [Algicola sp.]|nr:peptidase M64 [Algicola sp.]
MKTIIRILILSIFVLSQSVYAANKTGTVNLKEAVGTMRLDYFHTGNSKQEFFSVDEVVIEPHPWAGNPNQPIDTIPRGKYLFEVFDLKSSKLLYSRSFSSIYGEWEYTGEATRVNRTFHESLRFPAPKAKVQVVLKKRSYSEGFKEIWRTEIDPAHMFVNTGKPRFDGEVFAVIENGDPAKKVDLLIMGDGYSKKESAKFHADVKRLADALFATEPFKSRQQDFNVWAVLPNSDISGISRPSTGVHKDTPLALRYDIFGSERYMLTLDNKSFREIASQAPYEFVEIVANGETYGGGGIYGLYGTTSSDNDWSEYVFIHEFGHHFAGLADEYYASPVAQAMVQGLAEPYEPNVTANTNKNTLKWQQYVKPLTPIPTHWDKEAYDVYSNKYQKRRREIRAQKLPESIMNELFAANSRFQKDLFSKNKYKNEVGLFEGANYEANGYYRSEQNCIMFTRDQNFCHVCSHAIEQIVDLYSK